MSGRVVVVTGARQGIGLAVVQAFARAGDTVIATTRDGRVPATLGDVGFVETVQLDVTDQASVDAMAAHVLAHYGCPDVVVNNAGRGFTGTTEELTVEIAQQSLDVNFLGVLRVTQAFLPSMRAAGTGRLIAVSSIAGSVGQPFCDAYAAAKHALEGLYESMHPVAQAGGVYVSLIQPGPVTSDHVTNSVMMVPPTPAVSALKQRYLDMTAGAFARAQTPDEVAVTVLRCADDAIPALRYQTSRLAEKIVGLQLADPSGRVITDLTAGWISEPDAAT